MSVQRIWEPVGSVNRNAEIERLRLQLAAFNEQIEKLEKQHPDASKIEALKVSALVLARQIDEIRCSSANELDRSAREVAATYGGDRQRPVQLLLARECVHRRIANRAITIERMVANSPSRTSAGFLAR